MGWQTACTTAIQSDSRTVALAPGVTAQLLAPSTPGQATTIDVSVNTDGIRSALSSVADAYNAVVDLLDQQHGKDAGSLSGLSILNSLSQSLREITSYTSGSGSIQSLTQLGLELDQSGKLSLNSTAFNAAAAGGTGPIMSFLGDSSSGGFLKIASDALKMCVRPVSGRPKSRSGLVKSSVATPSESPPLLSVNDMFARERASVYDVWNCEARPNLLTNCVCKE